MSQWQETYRGSVMPWECDMVEHFTIAYYFDRFGESNLWLMESVGMGRTYTEAERRACASVRCYARFERELRAGDVFHIDSAVTGVDGKAVHHGHKVIDSASGEAVASVQQTCIHFDMDQRKSLPIPEDRRAALAAARLDWDGPAIEDRPNPDGDGGFILTGKDGVKSWEIDVLGHFSFQFYIHRFSMAAAHAMAAFGMTPEYNRKERRGMSTFELDVRFLREMHEGDLIEVKTGLVHLGRTSFRLLHRMTNGRSGEVAAEMSQFGVHLDMDARQPAPFPDALRKRAESLLIR